LCAVHSSHPLSSDTKEPFRAPTTFRGRIAKARLDVPFCLHTIEGGVDGADRHLTFSAEFNLLSHGHSIGSFFQPQQRQHDDVLEFTQVIRTRHFLYNTEYIVVVQNRGPRSFHPAEIRGQYFVVGLDWQVGIRDDWSLEKEVASTWDNPHMQTGKHERRQLGLPAATAVVTGEAIALGIFLTPAAMAKSLGSPLLLGLVWLGVAFMTMCGALSYSELAIRFPESGGEYVYLRAGYGEQVAFLYGWTSSIVMYPGVAAALAVGAAPYVAQLLPPGTQWLTAVPALLLCTFGAINLAGTRFSAAVMSFVNGFKLLILFSLIFWAVVSGHAHTANLVPLTVRRAGSEPLFPAIAGGVMSAVFSFGGWWEASKIAGEIRNPTRTLPLAFLGGVSLVTIIYLLISATFLAVVPLDQVTSNTAFVAQFGGVLFGAAGARVLSGCVLVCVCGGIAAITMAAPRVCYAMAKTGAFWAGFGKLHPRFGTPANAVLLQTVLALAVLFLGAFDRVLSYIIFPVVLFLALAASTLFRLKAPVRGWWFPFAPIAFIILSLIIAFLILMHNPLPALIGVGIVLCGLPFRKLLLANQPAMPLTSEES
jgi:basic amino acid/polyamine antiporter, APA family